MSPFTKLGCVTAPNNWEHLTDTELAKDIRERISEINMIVSEACSRDIIVEYRIHASSLDNNPVLGVTTSQRI